ncbi:MAG: DMT family transporter [Chthoniobacterales bacterium]|nr:DMT family transporter [Chthoniobacterales bacterium]
MPTGSRAGPAVAADGVSPARLFILTALAMIAFAGNSLLCRAALKGTAIDPASFTFIRIASGAIVLWLALSVRNGWSLSAVRVREDEPAGIGGAALEGNWLSALALFVYAAAFSFAYLTLSAGTGALLLFAAVQATMILWGLRTGERLAFPQIAGLVLAFAGLVVLVFPGLAAPPIVGSLLMLSAGIAWGIYSLRGKHSRTPAAATAGNFLRAVPLAAFLSIVFFAWMRLDWAGVGYAVLSGAAASGAGYVIWYAALPHLRAASAATVQLSVPVLTAAGGILLLDEPLTLRFVVASFAVLGGIALVVAYRGRT